MRQFGDRRRKLEEGSSSSSGLPENIVVAILLQVSLRVLFLCKSVCKPWKALLSENFFATQRFNLRRSCCLLRSRNHIHSRYIYLAEPVDFESFHPNRRLGCRLKLPGKNLQIDNSCNGMLCLRTDNYPVFICNPITRQYVKIHNPGAFEPHAYRVASGFGVNAANNTYKVIVLYMSWAFDFDVSFCLVQTIGLERYIRTIDAFDLLPVPRPNSVCCPTAVNGSIYFLARRKVGRNHHIRCLLRFDVETETFEFPIPLPELAQSVQSKTTIGVLCDRLYVCSSGMDNTVHVFTTYVACPNNPWVEILTFPGGPDDDSWVSYPYVPMMYLRHGPLLFLNSFRDRFITMDRTFRVRGFGLGIEAVPHVESIVTMPTCLTTGRCMNKVVRY